jgi:hypothetical protein
MRTTLGVLLLLVLASCASTSSSRRLEVWVTTHPEVLKGCKFLDNVEATFGWEGSASTGLQDTVAWLELASWTTQKDLQNKTARLGGNVVYVVASGAHASGEAYRCEAGVAERQKQP